MVTSSYKSAVSFSSLGAIIRPHVLIGVVTNGDQQELQIFIRRRHNIRTNRCLPLVEHVRVP